MRLPPRGDRFLDTGPSQRALDGFDLETLDNVALLHVLIIGESHAAFLADLNLAHFVLEALERRQIAFVNDDIVADQANLRATTHQAFGDLAARHLADLADGEDFQDFRVAEEFLSRLRRQHARQRGFDVVNHVVDDAVIADIDAITLDTVARLIVGANIEADHARATGMRQDHIAFGN